jgi:nitrogen fixation protein NifU and related proteins
MENDRDVFAQWLYTEVVKEHFTNPRNVLFGDETEVAAQSDGIGIVGSPVCGDMMKVFIRVDHEKQRIVDFRWKTFGCASAIASTSMLSEMVMENGGMSVEDAFKLRPQDILERLGGLPERKIHCSVLGDKALRAALRDYLIKSHQENHIPPEPTREVCHCLAVTEADIEEAVLEHNVRTFEQLQERTKISTGCGQCQPEAERTLQRILDGFNIKTQ